MNALDNTLSPAEIPGFAFGLPPRAPHGTESTSPRLGAPLRDPGQRPQNSGGAFEARGGRFPFVEEHDLHVGAHARALGVLGDIGDQAFRVGEDVVAEGEHRAFRADFDALHIGAGRPLRAGPVGSSGLTLLHRTVHMRIGLEFHISQRVAHFLDPANINVLHGVTRLRIDADRTARALPGKAFHGFD